MSAESRWFMPVPAGAAMRSRSRPNRRRGTKGITGFTLIELMIVVAVVAILAAIAYPAYQEQVRKSRRGQAKADLVELAQRAERFHTVNNTYVGFEAWVPAGDLVSPRGGGAAYYDLDISNESPLGFDITATPIAGTPQAVDKCGVLTIDSTGVKTHSKGADDECQFGSMP